MRTGVFLRWLAHPLTVGATAVLLVNDHVLKPAWPGLVTGKLSDVAGLVVAPPVLGLLLGLFLAGRVAAAAAVLTTGAGFALVKLTAGGAGVASAAWSVVNGPSVILADPADLVALPALGLSWWVWRRVTGVPPLPDRLAFRVRVVVAVPFTVLAITATSAPSENVPAVESVKSEGSQVVIEADHGIYSSASGVDGWQYLSQVPVPKDFSTPAPKRQTEACVPDAAAHCYRVRGSADLDQSGMLPSGGRQPGVDETTDAGRTWNTAWELPAARWEFVFRQHPFPAGVVNLSKVGTGEVAVRAVPGGHEVIVANGVEGLVIRGADGAWRRVPVVVAENGLDIRPAPLTGFGRVIGDAFLNAGLLAVLALLTGTTVAAGRVRARLGRGLTAVVPLILLVVLGFPVLGVVVFFLEDAGRSTGPWLVTALCLLGIGAGLTLAQRLLYRPRMTAVVAAAVLTGLACVGPPLGWTLGHPQEHGPAADLGLLLAAACLPVIFAAGWWAGARDPALRPVMIDPPWPRWPSGPPWPVDPPGPRQES
ncbi:hypothetical protein [Amycolatopsis sp. DG1A-15b]|uniref:hypothetical protein n=1 Tax=Amycolatopsis sp. DG1A-15b TaxID=3052846 RepID=UPI00255B5EC8|nr:hypothetical protein [Amycolatopsis sp. DG1A-15b]WIX84670.1 hypothetical protein QRY02_25810 [Amycolatopsis sp. DG1A-15b]